MPSDPLQQYLLIGVSAFIAGYLVAMLGRVVSGRVKETVQDPRDHQIRALEADLRLAERQAKDQGTQTTDKQAQLEDAVAQVKDLKATVQQADTEMRKLKEDLKTSLAKTVELRHELTNRAEQTIRGQRQLDDLQTELQVTKAGNDAVVDEINRLNQESKNPSDSVDDLDKLLIDD
jgi:chromosome segregation ATPase